MAGWKNPLEGGLDSSGGIKKRGRGLQIWIYGRLIKLVWLQWTLSISHRGFAWHRRSVSSRNSAVPYYVMQEVKLVQLPFISPPGDSFIWAILPPFHVETSRKGDLDPLRRVDRRHTKRVRALHYSMCRAEFNLIFLWLKTLPKRSIFLRQETLQIRTEAALPRTQLVQARHVWNWFGLIWRLPGRYCIKSILELIFIFSVLLWLNVRVLKELGISRARYLSSIS